MNINLRNVRTLWLNLAEHTQNAVEMTEMLNEKGFTNHARSPGIRVSGYDKVDYYQKVDHYIGVGLAQLNAMQAIRNCLPALILEDDVRISGFSPVITVPDDTDAVYLGYSVAGNAFGRDIGNGYAKIENVMSGHGILYVSQRYLDHVIAVTKHCLFDLCAPFDIGTANIQKNFNVIAPHHPLFYQANDKQSQNKWEALTSTPIRLI